MLRVSAEAAASGPINRRPPRNSLIFWHDPSARGA